MTAFNIVRFRVQPGREDAFVDAHRRAQPAFKGFVGGAASAAHAAAGA